ncbi:MAG: SRPBCC domain-containing protein [Thermoleophilaceae bacterium]
MELTREITLPVTADEVWRSLAEPAWLGEDASIELRPDGDVRAGERTGFVEEAEEPRRLVFWWAAPGEDSSRVELELEEEDGETHVRVVESRPLALLDMYGAAIVGGAARPQQPEMQAHAPVSSRPSFRSRVLAH